MLCQNPHRKNPVISESACISETAVIVGDVTIGDNVYVAHNAVIRADEPGSSVNIGNNCNVQDNVIIHGLSNSQVIIEDNTSLAHGCIVHGPCRIGKGCFVGFGAVVFDCNIEDDVVILHNATVRGVDVSAEKVIYDGQVIVAQKDVECLECITPELATFKGNVVNVNIDLVCGYKDLDDTV